AGCRDDRPNRPGNSPREMAVVPCPHYERILPIRIEIDFRRRLGVVLLERSNARGVDRVDKIEAFATRDLGDHLERALQRLAGAFSQRRAVADRLQLLIVEIDRTAIGERASRTSAVAIV